VNAVTERPLPLDPPDRMSAGAPDPAPSPAWSAAWLGDPRALLHLYGVRPRKSLGQHFLVDRAHLARIVAAAEVEPDDVVLEIGPGLGVLTDALASRARRVVAVEIDAQMRRILADTLRHRDNVTVIPADILKADPGTLIRSTPAGSAEPPRYKVVANLPYNITSAVLRHLLEAPDRPSLVVVMVQREVADRILAAPGDLSVLAVAVQFYAEVSRVSIVPATAFHPRPKVDSAVLRLTVRSAPPVPVPDVAAFFRVVRAGFGQKRKQLRNSLASGLSLPPATAAAVLATAGIDPARRAETLNLAEWAALTAVVAGLDLAPRNP